MKIATLFALVLFALPSFASRTEILALIQLTHGNIYAGKVPTGYSSRKVENLVLRGQLKTFIETTTQQKQKDWVDFVFTSGEFEGTDAELRSYAADPLGTLQVQALLEISEVYAIYKGNRLIGYYLEISDFVQSAIYQDGAWYEMFTDERFQIVQVEDHSA